MKIAIVGSGISGLVAAEALHAEHEITLYEKDARLGGHVHTHSVEQAGRRYEVDSGFIVFNDWTYPHFIDLLARHGVEARPSTMSFSVRDEASGLEYNGTNLDTLFAQRRNLLRPSFLGMLRDILRFHREAPRILAGGGEDRPLRELLREGGYGEAFVRHYIVPMGAAIWSTDPRSMMAFPARFFVRFLANHGMLSIDDRPTWRTVRGGSARYVERVAAPFMDRVRLDTAVQWIERRNGKVLLKAAGSDAEAFDALFLACHSDQALALLRDATFLEREVLGAIPYQRNEAVLHTDTRLLPRQKRAWAAWNYHVLDDPSAPVALTYNMNILQGLDAPEPFLVTLNRTAAIDPARVLRRMVYHHPLFTPESVAAQARHTDVDGERSTFFCGAYWRNGFHEDGVVSALDAVRHFRAWVGAGQRRAA
jgi:predicted NAD/FAD-binding protein